MHSFTDRGGHSMSIGQTIKELRLRKGISQSELAEVFHISAQAISKWESDTSLPDISQLPVIASYFGVTIDELFEYPTDLEYERIDQMVENGKVFTNEMFCHAEEFLLKEIHKNPKNHRAISTLGDLYHFHACRLNDKAIHYAMCALELKPDNKFDLNTLNNASNGYIDDWNISCHYQLIEKLQKLVTNTKQNGRTKLYLLDNLIADYRLDEAQAILDEGNIELETYYRIWIQEVQYGFEHVKGNYEQLLKENVENWKILMAVGNRYACSRHYEEAIRIYEQAFMVADKPRYTDMLACIAYLYQSLGQYDKAMETFERELVLLKEEWNMTKGELVDSIRGQIDKLKMEQ